MNLSLILLTYNNNSWASPRNHYGGPMDSIDSLLIIGIVIFSMLLLIIASSVEWDEFKMDVKNYFFRKILGKIELVSHNVPLGLKYILLNMGIKSRHIKRIYKINRKYLKKMDTYFSYEVITNKEKFHIYFDEVNGDKSWFIYKKGHFNNKPLRIKNNYYDIIEVINNNLFDNIKNNFHKRLKEQSFDKV